MKAFEPRILLEDHPRNDLTEIQMNELLSHSTSRLIWGEGNPLAPLFVILDNPGARENKFGELFLCGTRETLQRGLFDASISIENAYVSYLLKSRPLKKYDKERARSNSLKYLVEQIKLHQPQVVLCLGDVVAKSYFENPSASVKELRGHAHQVQNIRTVVSYHPLAVRRRPVLYKYFVEDLNLAALELEKAKQLISFQG